MWKKGPMPPDTYGWGGVVEVGEDGNYFHFADFCGDTVKTCPDEKELKPHEVAWYDNSLTLPPKE